MLIRHIATRSWSSFSPPRCAMTTTLRLMLAACSCMILSSCYAPYAKRCADRETRTSFSVTISKGACYGACPTYTATVYGDRSIEYNGERFVERSGLHTGTVSSGDLCAILTEVAQRGLMQSDTSFVDEDIADAPMTSMTISYKGQSTTVRWNLTIPEQFRTIHALMVKNTHENPELAASH